MAHVAGLDEIGDRADRLLDRHRRIDARRPVEIDVVGTEPLQRIGDEVADRDRPRIVAGEAAGRIAQRAELHADQHLLARAAAQRIADQHFVVAHPVEIAGVEQRDPVIERGVQRRDAFVAVGRAVEIRHAHAAEPDRRYLRARAAQLTCVHVRSFAW
ncbi:hypothetical protein WL27_15990 [Burkholderia multivorans]|nr:hypothetical protein WL27_15990 [Burkholderia multivorans]